MPTDNWVGNLALTEVDRQYNWKSDTYTDADRRRQTIESIIWRWQLPIDYQLTLEMVIVKETIANRNRMLISALKWKFVTLIFWKPKKKRCCNVTETGNQFLEADTRLKPELWCCECLQILTDTVRRWQTDADRRWQTLTENDSQRQTKESQERDSYKPEVGK